MKKLWKLIQNILFAIFMIVMVGLIFITAQSRFTGREPSLLGHRIYIVDSGSMSPTIRQESMILVKEMEPEDIKVRDIVTYRGSGDSKVTHRVTGIEGIAESFITRGDANDSDDPLPLEGERIIGKVVFTMPYLGYILRFLGSTRGIILVVILGGLWIVIPALLPKAPRESGKQEALGK